MTVRITVDDVRAALTSAKEILSAPNGWVAQRDEDMMGAASDGSPLDDITDAMTSFCPGSAIAKATPSGEEHSLTYELAREAVQVVAERDLSPGFDLDRCEDKQVVLRLFDEALVLIETETGRATVWNENARKVRAFEMFLQDFRARFMKRVERP